MTSSTHPAASPGFLLRTLIAAVGLSTMAIAGCRTAAPPTATPPAAATPPTTATSALPDSIRWVRDAAEYRAAVFQTYRAATAAVGSASAGRGTGTWAVVLDADETVISNLQYQIELAEKHQTHTAEAWRAWVARRAAIPLPGAAAFLSRTRELGGRIAIVTNRLGSECEDTESVFRDRGLVFDMMLCRPDGTTSDKNPRFASVAAGTTKYGGPPLEVLLFLGDNILDFPNLTQAGVKQNSALIEPFGNRFFVLPNPMYGSWQ